MDYLRREWLRQQSALLRLLSRSAGRDAEWERSDREKRDGSAPWDALGAGEEPAAEPFRQRKFSEMDGEMGPAPEFGQGTGALLTRMAVQNRTQEPDVRSAAERQSGETELLRERTDGLSVPAWNLPAVQRGTGTETAVQQAEAGAYEEPSVRRLEYGENPAEVVGRQAVSRQVQERDRQSVQTEETPEMRAGVRRTFRAETGSRGGETTGSDAFPEERTVTEWIPAEGVEHSDPWEAEALSRLFQRDARRYDGGFSLY